MGAVFPGETEAFFPLGRDPVLWARLERMLSDNFGKFDFPQVILDVFSV